MSIHKTGETPKPTLDSLMVSYGVNDPIPESETIKHYRQRHEERMSRFKEAPKQPEGRQRLTRNLAILDKLPIENLVRSPLVEWSVKGALILLFLSPLGQAARQNIRDKADSTTAEVISELTETFSQTNTNTPQKRPNYYLIRNPEDANNRKETIFRDQSLFEEVAKDPRLKITNQKDQKKIAQMMQGLSFVESGGNQFAGWPSYLKYLKTKLSGEETNPAIGYTQIRLKNLREMNKKYNLGISEDPKDRNSIFDKRLNLLAGTAYFREVYQQFPDFEIAAAAYYLGEGRLILGVQEAVITRLGEQMREAILASFEQMGLAADEERATTHYINTMGITLEEILKNPQAVDRMMQNQNYIEDSREITQHAKRYGDALEALGFGRDFDKYRNLPMT